MVTRYVCTSDGQDMWEDETGDFVDYEDYAKLSETNHELLEALQQSLPHLREQAKQDGHAFGTLQLVNRIIAKAMGETK